MNVAVILASGSGKRFGLETNKVFEKINNKTIILQTIEQFIKSKNIDFVLPVIAEHDQNLFKNEIKTIKSPKLLNYAIGGKERKHSSYHALLALKELNPKFVLFHDAARPFVTEELIENVVKNLTQNPSYGFVPALSCLNTIKQSDSKGNVVKTLERKSLKSVQTPQGFFYKSILESYTKHINKENITDDASIFELDHKQVKCITGEKQNIKITYKEDIEQMTNYVFKTGTGFDVHNFCEGSAITLAGIKIPYVKKLEGHSDADVVLHALTDAILGSLAKGDIGDHFPDNDQTFKDMDSSIFLLHAYKLLKEEKAELVNIDLTILAQEPKLTNHKLKMQANIAKLLNLNVKQVNVKATTTEKLGFIGRKEGIACMASVSIKSKETNYL